MPPDCDSELTLLVSGEIQSRKQLQFLMPIVHIIHTQPYNMLDTGLQGSLLGTSKFKY